MTGLCFNEVRRSQLGSGGRLLGNMGHRLWLKCDMIARCFAKLEETERGRDCSQRGPVVAPGTQRSGISSFREPGNSVVGITFQEKRDSVSHHWCFRVPV